MELPARRGFSISYMGKTLLSRFDPVTQGERLAAEFPVNENTLYFCPSPLYGYGLAVFLNRLPGSSAILCVEADEKLFEISRKAFAEQSPGKNPDAAGLKPLALVQASQAEKLCAFVRETWGGRRFRRVEELRLGGGWQLFPQLYGDFAHTLRREMALEWGNAMTLIRLGRLYARNLIRNLALLPESENITALDFGSSPVLVLGAGPSLDTVLDALTLLSAGRRRFKIICVDTCLPALHERSILPDLALVLESQHWNLRDFSGARGREINAAFDLSALPASARVLGGRRFLFATPWTELALFKRLAEAGLLPETFTPLGSVGLSAVAVALRLSSGPVLTGGIDFSYTPDSFHARSTPGYLSLERTQCRTRSLINAAAAFREGTFTALSKTGLPVRSDPAMRGYRDLFEREFGGNARVSDIAGTGLPLGVKTVSLHEASAILNGDGCPNGPQGGGSAPSREKVAGFAADFVRRELGLLEALKGALSGTRPLEPARLEGLLDSTDYLWAHFPECAGAGGRRPAATNLSFLKRVRTEIDPFLKCWETALGKREY